MPRPAIAPTSPWTPTRRAAQAAAIRRWAPWAKSTGPRTAAGKARSAQNAARPERARDPERRLARALKLQRRYLIEINRHMALRKFFAQNELLKRARRNHEKSLHELGRAATRALFDALLHLKLCKNLDFWDGFPVKVNANDDRNPQ